MTQQRIWKQVKPAVNPRVRATMEGCFDFLKKQGLFAGFSSYEEWVEDKEKKKN